MRSASFARPDRAVVDIGSNTVRLVIYAGPRRAPRTWLNESVNARLGRDLAATGEMPAKAMAQALSALARYAAILRDLGIGDVQTVATAAVRAAANGSAFLAEVEALGLRPKLLSGEEEAAASAYGVIGAFAGARGVVADLGGGSLELVAIANDRCGAGVSLPLGTLRLAALRAKGADALAAGIKRGLQDAGDAPQAADTLYLVGGTWRALASCAIAAGGYPLSDSHGFAMDADHARRTAKALEQADPQALEAVPGVSAMRAASLPDAAVLLRALLGALRPRCVVASSWGLREGLLMRRLPARTLRLDPLLVGVADFAEPRGGASALAARIAEWGDPGSGPGGGPESGSPAPLRLRLTAAQLALAASHVEANLRARHAFEWAMDKRWIGLLPAERAWLAAAVVAATGKLGLLADLDRLAEPQSLRDASGWGLTVRLARRLAAGSPATLARCRLERGRRTLRLVFAPGHGHLCSPKTPGDLKALAQHHGLEPEIVAEPAG